MSFMLYFHTRCAHLIHLRHRFVLLLRVVALFIRLLELEAPTDECNDSSTRSLDSLRFALRQTGQVSVHTLRAEGHELIVCALFQYDGTVRAAGAARQSCGRILASPSTTILSPRRAPLSICAR